MQHCVVSCNLSVRVFLLCLVRVGADITLLREREVDYDSDRNTRKIAEVLVRKVPDDQQVRVCPPGAAFPAVYLFQGVFQTLSLSAHWVDQGFSNWSLKGPNLDQ